MNSFHSLITAVLLLTCAGPALADEVPPPDTAADHTLSKGMYVMGATILASPYPVMATTATIGVTSGNDTMAWLYLPVAGPFIVAREAEVPTGQAAALITAGIVQSMGLGLLITAPFAESYEEERSEALAVYPIVSPSDVGLGMTLVF